MNESSNLSGDDRAVLPLPGPVRLAVQAGLARAGPRRFAADLPGSGISNASTGGSQLGAIARGSRGGGYTLRILSMFVIPETPMGVPAATMMLSPLVAKPSLRAVSHAKVLFSSSELIAGTSIEWMPQANVNRRAVSMLAAILSMEVAGRSRDARRLLDPELV